MLMFYVLLAACNKLVGEYFGFPKQTYLKWLAVSTLSAILATVVLVILFGFVS